MFAKGPETHQDEEEEPSEPNVNFVRAFDNFTSYSKAAGFIEDWIRTKKHNATDFATDFPAIVTRGCQLRSILQFIRDKNGNNTGEYILNADGAVENPEVRGVQHLILTKKLHPTESDWVFYFIVNVLEAACQRPELPVIVIKITVNIMKIMIDEGKLKLTEEHRTDAIPRLPNIRPDVVFDFVKVLGLSDKIEPDYFEKLATEHLENKRY